MCYQPITIKTPSGYKKVPCGHCLECLRKYQSDWSNRMYEQLKSVGGKAVFFTLTYDNDSVPKNYLYFLNAGEYEIFRSTSDYKYDKVEPYQELQDLGLDIEQIKDFNIPRSVNSEYKNKLQRIYAKYIDMVATTESCGNDTASRRFSDSYDFDNDFCSDDSLFISGLQGQDEETGYIGEGSDRFIEQAFSQVISDSDYQGSSRETEVNELVSEVNQMTDPTFRERPIMMFNSVRKKDIQDWLKRGRKNLKDKKISYFITSEYGPRTLRPHYHGILFGVDAIESNCMKQDWIRHFGKMVSWDNVDLSKGDLSYCAKYCAKGFYQHPLCSKDFFYTNPKAAQDSTQRPYTEYHSKHYERCIEIFGVDEAIVDPTFILVSKGLGVKWAEDNKDRFDDAFKRAQEQDFAIDATPTITLVRNDINTLDEYNLDEIFSSEFEPIHKITKPINTHTSKLEDYEAEFDRLFQQYKYIRTIKGKTYQYGVPKYYRTKIFGDALRCAFANYVQSLNVKVYREKLGALQSNNPTWSDAEVISFLEKQEREDKYSRMTRIKAGIEKTYNKSKI